MAENTAPNQTTFDLSPPRRPGADDFNGLNKINEGGLPIADPEHDPSAEEWNTLCDLAISVGAVAPLAILVIKGGASPSIQHVLAPGHSVTPETFLLTRLGAGNLRVRWLTSDLPPSVAATVSVFADAAIDSERAFPWLGAGAGYQGYETKTSVGGTLTDVDIILTLF